MENPLLPAPATSLSSQRHHEQCVLSLCLFPVQEGARWRQGGLEDTVGPPGSLKVDRYHSW